MMTNGGLTAADAILLGDRNNGSNSGNGMFGQDGWWVIVLFLIWGMWGFGGNGFGGNGGSGMQGALTRGDLCNEFSFNDLQNGVRNVNDAVNLGFANLNSTICHQQYDTAMQTNAIQAAVNGGFSALNSTICQQQYDTASQLNAMNMANMQNANAANVVALQNANAIQAQLAQCCCDNKAGQAQISYDMATNTCAIQNTIQNATRDILDRLTQQEMAAKDAQIAAQNQRLFAAELAASQANQTSNIVNTLRPFPVAAYQVCNPFTGTYGYQGYGSAAYGGCGCGCGC